MFQPYQNQLSLLIANLKDKYYSTVDKQLLGLSTNRKTYWYIFKGFLSKLRYQLSRQFLIKKNLL